MSDQLPATHPDPDPHKARGLEVSELAGGLRFFEVSNEALIDVRGIDAPAFLQGMVTQDVVQLPVGGGAPAFILDHKGKMIAPLFIYRPETGTYQITLPAETASQVVDTLKRFVIMEDVSITRRPETRCLSVPENTSQTQVSGPNFANPRLGNRHPIGRRDWWYQEAEEEGILQGLHDQGLRPASREAVRQAAIESFHPQYPWEYRPDINIMAFKPEQAVSKTKGCYIGQEPVAMTRDRGRPPFILCRIEQVSPENRTVDDGALIDEEGKAGGFSTSTTCFSQTFGTHIGFAFVPFKKANIGNSLHQENGAHFRIAETAYERKAQS